MTIVLFTKLFKGKDIGEVADAATSLGFDGIDLLVRHGFQVEPEQPGRIRAAVGRLQEAGLSVPMATTDLTDPDQLDTERLFDALAESGIGTVRLGYWTYDPSTGYAAILDMARRHLDRLTTYAQAADIRLTIQLHGGTIHGSGAQTLALLQGYAPGVLGAYPDPGNQVVQDGREDWRYTFEVLKPWLAVVGIKNGGWFPSSLAETGQRTWHSDWLGLDEGMVPWDDIVAHLKSTSFDGIYTLHSHYDIPYPQVIDKTRLDVNYVRRLLAR